MMSASRGRTIGMTTFAAFGLSSIISIADAPRAAAQDVAQDKPPLLREAELVARKAKLRGGHLGPLCAQFGLAADCAPFRLWGGTYVLIQTFNTFVDRSGTLRIVLINHGPERGYAFLVGTTGDCQKVAAGIRGEPSWPHWSWSNSPMTDDLRAKCAAEVEYWIGRLPHIAELSDRTD